MKNCSKTKGDLVRELCELKNEVAQLRMEQIKYKKIAEAHRVDQERLMLAIEVSGVGVYDHDIPLEKRCFVGERYAQIYGYRLDELPGKEEMFAWWKEKIHPDDAERVLLAYDHFLNGEAADFNIEYRIEHKSGLWRYVQNLSAAVDRDMFGRASRVVGVLRDITDRRVVQEEKENLIQNLRSALAEVRTLSGLLPICSACKKIRDDKGYWKKVEVYLRDKSGVRFSHGLCPECTDELYPGITKGHYKTAAEQ